jgi:predicted acylesterase/phospholipase RssA
VSPVRPLDHALVLSGGGATGAYSVGIVKALLAGKSPATGKTPFVPVSCAGTSIGSFNAAYLVSRLDSQGPMAAAGLESVWLNKLAGYGQLNRGNGTYRFRLDPLVYFDPASYLRPFGLFNEMVRDSGFIFWDLLQRLVHLATDREEDLTQRVVELFNLPTFVSSEPLQQVIREEISFASIRRSAIKLRIPAVNWSTGEIRYFTNPEMTDRIGPLAILASSSIPGLLPPVEIGAEPHVDGGVLMNTPLRLVSHHADILHVIYLDPDVRMIPLHVLDSTLGSSYRQQVIAWARVVNDDIGDAQAINQAVMLRERLAGGKPAAPGEIAPEQIPPAVQALLAELDRRHPPYRKLTIHRYHPQDDLTGGAIGLLRFESEHIQDLIDRGFADACSHDCQASGCLLPDRSEAPVDSSVEADLKRSRPIPYPEDERARDERKKGTGDGWTQPDNHWRP